MQQNCLYKYWGTIFSNPFHGISKMQSVSKCHLNVLGYTPRCHAWDLMIHVNIFLTGKNVNNSFKSLFTETEYLSPCNSFVSFLFLTNGITRCWLSCFFVCLFFFGVFFFFLPFLVNVFTYFSWVVVDKEPSSVSKEEWLYTPPARAVTEETCSTWGNNPVQGIHLEDGISASESLFRTKQGRACRVFHFWE